MKNAMRCILASVALCVAQPVDAQRQQASAPPLPSISAEAQAALDELAPRHASEIPLKQAWFRDRQIMYYSLGVSAQPASIGRVIWPIHGFDLKGNPVAIRGQRPIFSTLPGLDGYSGIWRLAYLVTADKVQPNVLRDIASSESLVRRGRAAMQVTNVTLNLPIMPKGSRLARDSATTMSGWYEGREVHFFDLGQASQTPAPMMGFVRGDDTSPDPEFLRDQFPVVDTLTMSPPYADLWELRYVRTGSRYASNSLKSSAAVVTSSFRVDPTRTIRNGPIVIVDGTRVTRAPSPLTEFADLRSPFPPAPTVLKVP
jgi:hypothetical protein